MTVSVRQYLFGTRLKALMVLNGTANIANEPSISYLDSGNKQGQLLDFIFQVFSVHCPRKIKHFGPVVNFRPEAVFQQFLGLAQILGRPKLIEMRKDAHDFGESVRLQNVQKFKGFHFETKFGVDAQEHKIGNFGTVQQCGRVIAGAF